MPLIAFIDLEVSLQGGRIHDIGAFRSDGAMFRKASLPDLTDFVRGADFVCGHNFLRHDSKHIREELKAAGLGSAQVIDTLLLSPLLFPQKPYHALLKDDKLQVEELNNPLNDAIKARDLYQDEVAAFGQLESEMRQILYGLLQDKRGFMAFFQSIGYAPETQGLEGLVRQHFQGKVCAEADLAQMIAQHSVELAYCLALIRIDDRYSITPPWVLRNHPEVEQLMWRLRSKPCLGGCAYCRALLDVRLGLKRYFGYDAYRSFGGEPLQERAVQAAIDNQSILVIFPTGGGKSITFQVPALMQGASEKGLTVVISPLQSLMKDQVDNLERLGITEAVTINGLLDPIDRAKSFERVEDGSASLLYISPESLRSRSIERLLLGRKVVRFVIDEAHCFSAWGQDFRVDYLYIGDFIQALQQKKGLTEPIPVSCFTATAKRKVVEDIQAYFREKLSLELQLHTTDASRTNLQYKVIEKRDDDDKYQALRSLIEAQNCPTIVYVSRTGRTQKISERLCKDGFNARPYHGKMESKAKTENQNAFVSGEVQIMVATSAFGMGVDKKDVGMVIHYDISDSLENYVQEAGRAGRDEKITAQCFVLFNEEDLGKHFVLLNQTKLSIKEIQQVWTAIKDITRLRSKVSNSALEIARKAGWDDNVQEIETRVTTAIAALEDAGYLKRGQNMPTIFANSILTPHAQEAIDKITASSRFDASQKVKAIRIIKKLFSSKSRAAATDESAESRIDYISDHLGIVKGEVIQIVNLLREEKILADAKDLTAFVRRNENKNATLQILKTFGRIEDFLLPEVAQQEQCWNLKELNQRAEALGYTDVTPQKLKTILNLWTIKHWINRRNLEVSRNHVGVTGLYTRDVLRQRLDKRHALAKFIVEFLVDRSKIIAPLEQGKEEVLVEFSVLELKQAFEAQLSLLGPNEASLEEVEDALFYLSRIEAIKIEGGFLVVYNQLTIERLEQDNKIRYKQDDYKKLDQFYHNKTQQIHIVGEYAKKMIEDYKSALTFVDDYFQLNYSAFLRKYFPGSRNEEINQNLTPAKFRELFGELSTTQLQIVKDQTAPYIVVAAGPGSGKTKTLVHKLASLLLMEDVKHEQLLMLTFSRAAATEFKKRLLKLIGNAAQFVEIKTFHAYCFDLLGRVGTLDKSDQIVRTTVERIRNGEVEMNRITKTVLVIDEAQDMNADEFALVEALMDRNEEMRVIAVGDDDQNIYEFRQASSKYLKLFIEERKAVQYELLENYRSASNLVEFTNNFVQTIHHRLKKNKIIAKQAAPGKLKIVRHAHSHLIEPLVQDLRAAQLAGTTCVLTHKNREASEIAGLLLHHGLPAKMIQSNDGFSLYNLLEVRYFWDRLQGAHEVAVLSDELWDAAKKELRNRFQQSSALEICEVLIRDFEAQFPQRKYKSDLEAFIRESKMEDFWKGDSETIFVSTMHKAKGREFDQVFLLVEHFPAHTDEAKRQLYVAMTRAKRHLTLHVDSAQFDSITAEGLVREADHAVHQPPTMLSLHLTLKDVWLDYFIERQQLVQGLMSGQALTVGEKGCVNANGQTVVWFSKKFGEELTRMQSQGYKPLDARVNFVLYWLKEGAKREVLVVLPEVRLGREAS